MIYQKQECNGALYQMCLYSMGTMPGMSPRQRAGRRRTTEKAKQEINRRQRKWRLMQLINANFVSGRDLFVCLTYAPEASRARALEKFHAKMKKAYAKLGLTYKYIAVTEEHDMDGEPVRLTPREYGILRLLMQHPGEVIAPAEIYRRVWQGEPMGAEGTVAVHIRHLREKIEIDPAEPRYLQVVWGQGYRLNGDGR